MSLFICPNSLYNQPLNILLEGHVIFDESYAYNCGMSVRNSELPNPIYMVHFLSLIHISEPTRH